MPLLIAENLQKKVYYSQVHMCLFALRRMLRPCFRSGGPGLGSCCCAVFLIIKQTLLHFVPDLHQLRCIKKCWLLFLVILFSVWSVEISSRFGQWCLQLHVFQERLSEKMCTWQSWKVARNMIKLYTVPDNSSCWTYFCCFPLAVANMLCPWPLVPFFQISLKNMYSELKATHIYLSGLSRALFATIFLEIADVYLICYIFLY